MLLCGNEALEVNEVVSAAHPVATNQHLAVFQVMRSH